MASENLCNIGSGNGLLPAAPSHYLNQCWLTLNEILWHSFEDTIYFNTEDINTQVLFENSLIWNHSHISEGPMSYDHPQFSW